MVDFIISYWVQELFALVIAAVTWLWKAAKARTKENAVIKEGMMALLHDRLFKACSSYIEQGWCSVEERSNLECLFKPYKALNGNGTAENLYLKCMDLPLSEPDDRDNKQKEEN